MLIEQVTILDFTVLEPRDSGNPYGVWVPVNNNYPVPGTWVLRHHLDYFSGPYVVSGPYVPVGMLIAVKKMSRGGPFLKLEKAYLVMWSAPAKFGDI